GHRRVHGKFLRELVPLDQGRVVSRLTASLLLLRFHLAKPLRPRRKRACQSSRAWVAMFAPKGTPKPILDKLTDALDRALDDDTPRKRLLDHVHEIPDKASRGQQPLADLVKKDIARWT